MYMFGREEAPVKIASEYAKQHGLHIVRIGWDFTNRKYCKDVRAFINPYDFVYLILHADYVVTNSFHGTAFSIKFNKQITILRNAIDPRFSTILKMFGLENRFLPAKDEPKVLEFMNKAQPIDYKKVNSELNKQMEASKSFLTTNLIAKG